jgi:hypothetical protein
VAVYVIRATGTTLYKVGTATDPARRLADLQTASPLPLELVCTIDGDRATETRIHRALSDRRTRGEWFDLPSQPTADDVISLSEVQPGPDLTAPVPLEECDPVGAVEIAERLGVQRATVDMWRQRPSTAFPPARWTIGARPAWNWPEIEAWARHSGRLPTASTNRRRAVNAAVPPDPGSGGTAVPARRDLEDVSLRSVWQRPR